MSWAGGAIELISVKSLDLKGKFVFLLFCAPVTSTVSNVFIKSSFHGHTLRVVTESGTHFKHDPGF